MIEINMAVHIASVMFDANQRTLIKGTQSRNLEPKAFNLLTTLLAANGQIVSRDQLIENVWKNRVVSEGAINRTVSLLRGHFAALTDENIIETVPTQGYRIIAAVENSSKEHIVSVPTKVSTSGNKRSAWFFIKVSCVITFILIILATFISYLIKPDNFTHSHNLSLISAPLIALNGWEYKLSTTNSGQQILFHHLDENNNQAVYLYDTKVHAKKRVLTDSLAAINANGTQLVYASNIDEQCSIAIYYVLTAKQQSLFNCDETPTSLVWGENNTFYFNKRFSKSHPYQVFSYNINTGRLRQITKPTSKNNAKGDFNFTYNHQTNQLAILRYVNENQSHIIITDEEQVITEHSIDLNIKNLLWHPNNNDLIIADNTRLYALNTTNSHHIELKQLNFEINSLALLHSDTGSSLLVSSLNAVSNITKYNIAKKTHVTWQQSGRTELLPRMKADTQLVLSTRFKSHHWWKIVNDGAQLINVDLPFDLQFVRYELSDDGKRILFAKHGDIYELNLDTDTYQHVFTESKNSYVANYDTDNNIIYSANHSGSWQLWHYQRGSAQHKQLTENGGYSGRIIGKYLYYSKFAVDGLWRKKINDPNEELVIADFNRINWLNWRVINNQLYFYRQETGIWAYNIDTQTEQLLMSKPDNFIHQYTISPDQQHIFWVRLQPVQGDIYQYAL